jgi:sulfite reductase (ferredoxin)
MSNPFSSITRKLSKVEVIKERSNLLREPIVSELLLETIAFSEDAIQLLKFHGSYQQDNRDNRVKGQDKDYSMMLRTRTPGGFVPPQLYLTLDRLSDKYGNHTIRVTTRQAFQLHGVLKRNLKATINTIIHNMGSTLTACGDVNRNVMSPPAPFYDRPDYTYARKYANNIADLLTPQSGAYYEIWLDNEKVVTGQEDPEVIAARKRSSNGTNIENSLEPIYGDTYLPRKFKVCVTVPGDNSVDLFSQDLSLVVITDKLGELEGFNLFAGGGLGRTHNKEETFPRIADPIGYVPKANVYDAVKAVVATQRDYGDRSNRRHARMKYLLEEWGVERFRAKVEEYFGMSFEPFKPLPEFHYLDFLGWHEQGDGKLFYGISVQNGRIKNEGVFRLKSALKKLVKEFNLPMMLTPSQNIILCDIQSIDRLQIDSLLKEYGISRVESIDALNRLSIACPALPTCGLATAESERIIPSVLQRIRELLKQIDLPNESFVFRMTGCPNGCARPYLAELAFVGNGPNTYQVWLGASPNQTRLAKVYLEKMNLDELEVVFKPVFTFFKINRQLGESFGDFCDRMGLDSIHQFSLTFG